MFLRENIQQPISLAFLHVNMLAAFLVKQVYLALFEHFISILLENHYFSQIK